MKKIKYPVYTRILNSECKLRFKSLSKIEKRNYRINKFFTVLFFFVFFFWTIVFLVFAKVNNNFITNKILSTIVSVFCVILFIPVSSFITWLHYLLFKRIIKPFAIGELTNDLIIRITQPLREYYLVPNDNFIVTKCYNSSDKFMINKDVLLFFADGKLRITNNFYRSIKDFGCYELDEKDTSVKNIVDNKVKTIIKCDDISFELGYKAKTYINKYWKTKKI